MSELSKAMKYLTAKIFQLLESKGRLEAHASQKLVQQLHSRVSLRWYCRSGLSQSCLGLIDAVFDFDNDWAHGTGFLRSVEGQIGVHQDEQGARPDERC